MELMPIFCCLIVLTIAYGSQGFRFPDQVEAKAYSSGGSWSGGFVGNSHGNALAAHDRGPRYPQFYRPNRHHGHDYAGHGHHDFAERYPPQGYYPDYDEPPPSYSQYQYPDNGLGDSSNSQSYNGNSISNAVSGSQSIGANGAASSSAAAASASTSFVNGIPVASAAAASSASAASPHGGASVSSSSNANSVGAQYPGYYNRPYDNYNRQPPVHPWAFRSGGSDDSKEAVLDASAGAIVFQNN